MKPEFENIALNNDQVANRFELVVDGFTAFMDYKLSGDGIILVHTEVPQELEGRGVGTAIVEKVFEYIEAKQLQMVALCPFVVGYLKRHPEWNRLSSLKVKLK